MRWTRGGRRSEKAGSPGEARALEEYAQSMEIDAIPKDEEVRPRTNPPNFVSYTENEFKSRAAEQRAAFAADGEVKRRKSFTSAALLAAWVKNQSEQVDSLKTDRDHSKKARDEILELLGPSRRREPHKKWLYMVAICVLWMGDVAGIAGAGIWTGEVPAVAVAQSVAAAAAAVVCGFIGREVADSNHTRWRDLRPDGPEPGQRPHKMLFGGPHTGERVAVRPMIIVAATGATVLAVGIFGLRFLSSGDPYIGLVYGAIALAVCIGSAINSYIYADHAADQIEHAEHDYRRAIRKHEKALSRLKKIEGRRDAAATHAASVKTEYADRGEAASQRVIAMLNVALRQNPLVMGHGTQAVEPAPQNPVPRSNGRTNGHHRSQEKQG